MERRKGDTERTGKREREEKLCQEYARKGKKGEEGEGGGGERVQVGREAAQVGES